MQLPFSSFQKVFPFSGSDNRRDAVYYREEQEKAIKCCRVQIDGRQFYIKVDETRHNGNRKIDQNVFAGNTGFSHKGRSFRTLNSVGALVTPEEQRNGSGTRVASDGCSD